MSGVTFITRTSTSINGESTDRQSEVSLLDNKVKSFFSRCRESFETTESYIGKPLTHATFVITVLPICLVSLAQKICDYLENRAYKKLVEKLDAYIPDNSSYIPDQFLRNLTKKEKALIVKLSDLTAGSPKLNGIDRKMYSKVKNYLEAHYIGRLIEACPTDHKIELHGDL